MLAFCTETVFNVTYHKMICFTISHFLLSFGTLTKAELFHMEGDS